MSNDGHHSESARTTLVSNGPFRVELCPCGTLHVTIGAITIRLAPDALDPLTDTLRRAADRLPAPAAPTTH